MSRKIRLISVFLVLALAVLACATPNPLVGVPLEETAKVYGFWNGLWDGMTAPIAFVGSLFGADWGVYQVHNNGNWYNLGFLLGIGAFTSGGGATVSRRQ